MTEINVVYSLGSRFFTELLLQEFNLIRFSSIFGTMNTKNYNNLIKMFDTNFKILFDEANLVYSRNNPSMNGLNGRFGYRTLNRQFDNVQKFHQATITHHDLSNKDHKAHYERGLARLQYIKENKVPILFVSIGHHTEFNNSRHNQGLINSIVNNGFTNFKFISFFLDKDVIEPTLNYMDDNYISYSIHTDSSAVWNINETEKQKIKELLFNHYKFDNLITLTEIDNLRSVATPPS